MSFLVVMIVDDPDNCSIILDAWEALDVTGVTILESTGLGRLRRAIFSDDIPLMPRLEDFDKVREVPHRTLLSVVESEEIVQKMVEAAQNITGDLNIPHTGFLFVLPVLKAYGLNRAD
jgi:nitrogen regulatory protein PII